MDREFLFMFGELEALEVVVVVSMGEAVADSPLNT
jgi:hypothetical protein